MSKDLITSTGLPHWMQPPKLHTGEPYTEAVLEEVMDRVRDGQTLTSICEDTYYMPDVKKLRRYIHANPELLAEYRHNQEIGAEKVEDEMIEIADAEHNSLEDVQRSTLKINTRKWLLGIWNRSRYGDTKQIDVNMNVDLVGAMDLARERLAKARGTVIEGEFTEDG